MPVSTPLAPLSWAHLGILTKKRHDYLCQRFGSLHDAWEHINPELLKELGCKEQTIYRVMNEVEELNAEEQMDLLEKHNIQFLTIDDDEFPEELRNIPDPPVFLFARGDLTILKEPSIAMVGTRAMSAYGKRVTASLVQEFVHAGLVTVSGLALGIDAEVAKETLHADGKHMAILGHGLGSIFPKQNKHLAEQIVENGGLLLSEYPLHTMPDKYTFPARNRIIAGLSLGTVVVEASAQSGSLITASLALDYGKEVFAIPGQIFDPNFQGTHQLIIQGGAKLITSANDVLQELGIVAPEKGKTSTYRPQTEDEKRLLEELTTMPQSVTDLVESSNLSTGTVNATLTLMELKGGAKNVGMGMWVKM